MCGEKCTPDQKISEYPFKNHCSNGRCTCCYGSCIFMTCLLWKIKKSRFRLAWLQICHFVKCQISESLDKYLKRIFLANKPMFSLFSCILTRKASLFGRHFVYFQISVNRTLWVCRLLFHYKWPLGANKRLRFFRCHVRR